MTENLFLFATIAGTPVAVRANEIEAVVRLGDIVPIQRVPDHVRGLAALRSRVLTETSGRDTSAGQARIANAVRPKAPRV